MTELNEDDFPQMGRKSRMEICGLIEQMYLFIHNYRKRSKIQIGDELTLNCVIVFGDQLTNDIFNETIYFKCVKIDTIHFEFTMLPFICVDDYYVNIWHNGEFLIKSQNRLFKLHNSMNYQKYDLISDDFKRLNIKPVKIFNSIHLFNGYINSIDSKGNLIPFHIKRNVTPDLCIDMDYIYEFDCYYDLVGVENGISD